MGVFNKLKSIFYDEVVVDEDEEFDKVDKIVKKDKKSVDEAPKVEELKIKPIEVSQEDEEKPRLKEKEDKKVEISSDRDLFRSERSFNFVDWDNEEEKLPPRKNVLDDSSRTLRTTEVIKDDTPKVFKPTPVISPIWGVLDKDYKKDEIKEKTVTSETISSSVTKYDSVRKKAYGTLEDELEDTLNNVSVKQINSKFKEEKKLDTRTTKIEDLIDKIDEAANELDKNMSIEEADNNVKLKDFDDEEDLTDKTLTDSTLEHDLFNLIDSMYDKED